ncbi:MAG: hypothetical protein IT210_24340 [Armatimonadetes bacterium]|nr:hypothetical protein [Armatimonadota bacterium]
MPGNILPVKYKYAFPSHRELPKGLLKVRLFPHTDFPSLMRDNIGEPEIIANLPAASGRLNIAGAWYCVAASEGMRRRPDAGQPALLYFVPVGPRPSGKMEYLLNRAPYGWMALVANHGGFVKERTEPPCMDSPAAQRVTVTLLGKMARVTELISGQALAPEDRGSVLRFPLGPGEMRLLKIELKEGQR